jgi:hypothetical protein
MKRHPRAVLALMAASLISACAAQRDGGTLAQLHQMPADTAEIDVADSLERALQSYRRFLDETPDSTMTPEAMRRLADLQIERQFGIIGDGEIIELPAPDLPGRVTVPAVARDEAAPALEALFVDRTESDEAFEQRTTSEFEFDPFSTTDDAALAELPTDSTLRGPLEAIRIYRQLLAEFPSYERADQVLYQMARAYDEVGQPDEAMAVKRLRSLWSLWAWICRTSCRRRLPPWLPSVSRNGRQ